MDKKFRVDKLKEIEKNIYQKNETQLFIETPYRNNQMIESILSTCRNETMLCIATDVSMDSEYIKTKSIAQWKKSIPDINKRATVFLLYK